MNCKQPRMAQPCVNNAILMDLLCTLGMGPAVPGYEDRQDAFSYQGSTATVEMDKSNGAIRLFCRGQEISVYDSKHPEACSNPAFVGDLVTEVRADMHKALVIQVEEDRKFMLARRAKKPV
ncbi:hypothetical protein V0M98_32285 (plasmid) [Pseudomonas silesiensis]|uniref:hypothetical protein n=1 Tax=Pseudomonas silesiensis TaxID=1853130 RepID=UPI0030CA81D5